MTATRRSTLTLRSTSRSAAATLAAFVLVSGGAIPRVGASKRPGDTRVSATADSPRLDPSFGSLPMAFEENRGQTDGRVSFLARGQGYAAFVAGTEVVLSLASNPRTEKATAERLDEPERSDVLRMQMVGAAKPSRIAGERELPGRSNYLLGDDSRKWLIEVPTFAAVRCEGIYPGVDLALYGNQRELEYDFVVAPGADPEAIAVRFDGAKEVSVDEAGDLVLELENGEIRQQSAAVYQSAGGQKRAVAARYAVGPDGEVRFDLGPYDRTQPLVVDPVLRYSTYLGGSNSGTGADDAQDVAVDASGAAYVTGSTTSRNFPIVGGFDGSHNGSKDVFVAKLSPSGSAIVYSTYLGGAREDVGRTIAVDASGNAYVAGYTDQDLSSAPFPTVNAFDATPAFGLNGFVAKLDPSGSQLLYSSYLGGNSSNSTVSSIAVDASGALYATGGTSSSTFPIVNAFDSTLNATPQSQWSDAFVTKVAPSGSTLVYSTYLGGNSSEFGAGIAVDGTGAAYVTGGTGSVDFPTAAAFDGALNNSTGQNDAFVAKLAPAGNALVYSTYLGGSEIDSGTGIAVDAMGAAYVAGSTSSENFPLLNASDGIVQEQDAFVTKLSPSGSSLGYSTFLGGGFYDRGAAVAVDAAGIATVVGETNSPDFLTVNAVDSSIGGEQDAFVSRIGTNGGAPLSSTFLGGSRGDWASGVAVDGAGAAWVVGNTSSTDFPAVGAADPTYDGGTDGFVSKLSAAGNTIAYSTFLGGNLADAFAGDEGRAVCVDSSGSVYVTGSTMAVDFPTTPSFDPSHSPDSDSDVFVTKLDPSGTTLVYSTFLGGFGPDSGDAIAVDASGAAYVAGVAGSADFPVVNAFDSTGPGGGSQDGFAAKLNPAGTGLVYSTYLGGSFFDGASGIAVDGTGSAVVAGWTMSFDFPVANALDDTFGEGLTDAFVTRLAPAGSSVFYSTYLGGASADDAYAVALDSTGAAYVTGRTWSSTFPTVNAFDATFSGGEGDAFVTKISPSGGAIVYSTFLGGEASDRGLAIATDGSGGAWVAGSTSSTTFPVVTPPLSLFRSFPCGFLTRVGPSGATVTLSTYLFSTGGASAVALDSAGAVYVTGETRRWGDFPLVNAFDATAVGLEGFVLKLAPMGSAVEYCSYLGGSSDDNGLGIAVDSSGAAYVVGGTYSLDFPTAPGFDTTASGTRDAFVVKVSGGPSAGADTPGIFAASTGAWFLRNASSAGDAHAIFSYGPSASSLVPLTGDWDGNGTDTPGLYDRTTGVFFLKNANGAGSADLTFTFGPGGVAWVPIAGDWDGDGDDSIGLYVPDSGAFFLKNANSNGDADASFVFGPGGSAGFAPLAGNWDGQGGDSVGLYAPGSGVFFLRNTTTGGAADLTFTFGGAGARALEGDWNGDGVDSVGIYVPAAGAWFLRNSNSAGTADLTFVYGPANATPLVGDWDGQ